MLFKTLVILLSALLLWSFPWQSPEFDLVITNGRIVDGTGNPWYEADLAVKDGKIAAIGRIASQRAAKTIEAIGLIVAPGFVDVHTHIESNIKNIPTADNFLRMGVTSVVTGNCGGSALPLSDWFADLEKTGISLNIAALAGHNNIRRTAMNGDLDRAPTPEELQKMRELMEQAMRDGAVGLSTGLIYIPGTYSKTDEIVEVAKVAAKHGGVYASHMRDEGNKVDQAIKEALTVGEQAGCPVEISHFKVSSRKRWGDSLLTTKLVADARARGQQVTVDQYLYTASSTNLGTQFPSWVFDGGRAKFEERVKDPTTRAKIKAEMIESKVKSGFKDFSHAYVANHRANPKFNGKNLAEITKLVRGKNGFAEEAEQIIEMQLAGGAQMIYHTMSDEDLARIFTQPFTMVASDAGVAPLDGDSIPHPRGFGNNARALGLYVREKKLVSLEDAIRKMSSLPAQTFRLYDRGLLRPGLAADIVIFDEKTIGDRATFQQPKQFAAGIEFVLVNGQVVIEKDRHTGAKAGKILRGHGAQR
jgi:N-acyl-D-amino-acid deacylase